MRYFLLGLLSGISLVLAAVAIGKYHRPRQFSEEEVDSYAKSVAYLNEMIDMKMMSNPGLTRTLLEAYCKDGFSRDPIKVWKDFRPLLEKERLSAPEFCEVRRYAYHLKNLAAAVEAKALEDTFEKLAFRTHEIEAERSR